LILLCV
jgi:hypothetical protein